MSEKSYQNDNLKGKEYIEVYIHCETNALLNRIIKVYNGATTGFCCYYDSTYNLSGHLYYEGASGTIKYIIGVTQGWEANTISLASVHYYL